MSGTHVYVYSQLGLALSGYGHSAEQYLLQSGCLCSRLVVG